MLAGYHDREIFENCASIQEYFFYQCEENINTVRVYHLKSDYIYLLTLSIEVLTNDPIREFTKLKAKGKQQRTGWDN